MKLENTQKKKKYIIWKMITTIFGVLILCVLFSYLLSTYGLMTSHYKVASDKLTGSLRVVSLTDLHGHSFGKDNRRLIRAVQKKIPDLIMIWRDLVDKNDPDFSTGEKMIYELAKIAPVYLSPGNHELEYDEKHSTEEECTAAV